MAGRVKFQKQFWVLIKSCSRDTVWYRGKIGTLPKVTNELFPPEYTLISKNENVRGLYPMIDHADAIVVEPPMFILFINWIKNILSWQRNRHLMS